MYCVRCFYSLEIFSYVIYLSIKFGFSFFGIFCGLFSKCFGVVSFVIKFNEEIICVVNFFRGIIVSCDSILCVDGLVF